MASKRKTKKKLPSLVDSGIVIMFTRKAGPMDHKLSKKRKVRDKRKRVKEALAEY